jgi:hypothetical protein
MKIKFKILNYNIKKYIHNELEKLSQFIKRANKPPRSSKDPKEKSTPETCIYTSTPSSQKYSKISRINRIEDSCSPIKMKEIEAAKAVDMGPKRVKVRMRVKTGIVHSNEGEQALVNNGKNDKRLILNMVEHDVKSKKNLNEHGIKEVNALGKSMDFSKAIFIKDNKEDYNGSTLNIKEDDLGTHDSRNALNENSKKINDYNIVKNFTHLVPRIRSIYNSTKSHVPKFNFPSLIPILKQASKGLGDFFLNIAADISVEAIDNQADLNIAEQSSFDINIGALTHGQKSIPTSTNVKKRNNNPQIISNQDRMLYSMAVKNSLPKITNRRNLVTTKQASKTSNSKNNNNTNSNNIPIETRRPYAQRARNNESGIG